MNEQAQKVLTDLLQKASNGIDSAVSFSQAQIPDVVHQLLVWKLVYSSVNFAIGLILLSVGYYVIYRAYGAVENKRIEKVKNAIESHARGDNWTRYSPGSSVTSSSYDLIVGGSGVFAAIIAVALCVINLIISISLLNLTWLKIWLAPKLYLLEYAASLIK